MSKKPVPVVPKRSDNRIFSMSSIEATRMNKPYMVVNFKTGAFKTKKDRPRDNNWKKWLEET